MTLPNTMSLSTAFTQAVDSASHMVTGHLMVGDFFGLTKGIFDYFTNQGALAMFHFAMTFCYIYTSFFTILLNDEGVAFYRCYKNFPHHVTFY